MNFDAVFNSRLVLESSASQIHHRAFTARSRLLDALRGLAACYVMLHHACLTVYPFALVPGALAAIPTFDGCLVLFFRAGSTPVALFIAISGFSLMLPVVKWGKFDGALSFYMRRIWRITPPYYMGLIISATLGVTVISRQTGSHWDGFIPFDLLDLIKHFLFIQNFSASATKINGAYWSIAAEMQIYVFFPLLVFLYTNTKNWMSIFLFMLFGIIASVLYRLLALPPNGRLYLFFALGACGAIISHSLFFMPIVSRYRVLLYRLCFLFGFTGFVFRLSGTQDSSFHYDLIVITSFVGWMVLDQTTPGDAKPLSMIKYLSSSVLAKIGVFAYSTYLIHEPIQQIIWQYTIMPEIDSKLIQLALVLIASILIVLPLSYAFYFMFELPFVEKTLYYICYDRLKRLSVTLFKRQML